MRKLTKVVFPRSAASWRHAVGICVFFGFAASTMPSDERDVQFKYRDYDEIIEYFRDLQREYPDIVETWVAQKEFPQILARDPKTKWAMCGEEVCKTLIVRIGRKANLSSTTPEVYFSGALHGDERVGPLVTTELAGFLCRRYQAGDPHVKRLVEGRATWITPMTNAHGFYQNRREENGMDPNRDFPYLQSPSRCMQTQTARTVNELFRKHLFHFVLTFHGGMRALTYEWGSRNHMHNRKSTESPDDRAFADVGSMMARSSGTDGRGGQFYPLGRINDLVYPVDGGMEDWSYGAGFENAPSPITPCAPTTYGGYAFRTAYKRDSLSALVYLAEADDAKTPIERTLGWSHELWTLSKSDGHVARNLRMSLKLIELARPELIIGKVAGFSVANASSGSPFSVEIRGFGCLNVNLRVLLLPVSASSSFSTCSPNNWQNASGHSAVLHSALQVGEAVDIECKGIEASMWDVPSTGLMTNFPGNMPSGMVGRFCPLLAAEFDRAWGRQDRPDPNIDPRSHAARSRLEEHYTAEATEGPMRVDEFRTRLFSLHHSPVYIRSSSPKSESHQAFSHQAFSHLSANVSAQFAAGLASSAPTGVFLATEDPFTDSTTPAVLLMLFAILVGFLFACNVMQAYRWFGTRGGAPWRGTGLTPAKAAPSRVPELPTTTKDVKEAKEKRTLNIAALE